ncbi:MAG: right-handed parallel beta-helix repeat-containing protein [Nanoarchaeota archaeon]|nr:right-handed parallel beta-helix repeat-containing protein [Nanoarchaeota archaeon]
MSFLTFKKAFKFNQLSKFVLFIILSIVFIFNSSSAISFTTCNATVPSGIHNLANNITNYSTTCFTFTASNTVFDCQNNIIDGVKNLSQRAFLSNTYNNITIKNCFIEEFGNGINIIQSVGSSIYNVSVIESFSGSNGVIYLYNFSNGILRNIYIDNYGVNVALGSLVLRYGADNNYLENISLYNGGNGLHFRYADDNIINNITVVNNSVAGIDLEFNSYRNIFTDVISLNNYVGIYYDSTGDGNNFTKLFSSGNDYGIAADSCGNFIINASTIHDNISLPNNFGVLFINNNFWKPEGITIGFGTINFTNNYYDASFSGTTFCPVPGYCDYFASSLFLETITSSILPFQSIFSFLSLFIFVFFFLKY